MKLFLSVILIFSLTQRDRHQGSLSSRDYKSGPIPFNSRIDSLLIAFGTPNAIERTQGFCGKGPIMRGNQVVEGDTVYCDSMITYTYDSLTICVSKEDGIEYYSFTMTRMKTARGIHVGDTKRKILSLYGTPTWMDSAYVFDELLPSENEAIQYVGVDDDNGIAFYLKNGHVHRIYIGRGSGC